MERWFKDLPFPPSANHFYIHTRRGVIKTKEYREFEKNVLDVIRLNLRGVTEDKSIFRGIPHAFRAFFYAEKSFWFAKNGNAKARDLDNRIKALQDSICKSVDLDDKWIFEIHAFKCIGRKRVDVYFTDQLTENVPLGG